VLVELNPTITSSPLDGTTLSLQFEAVAQSVVVPNQCLAVDSNAPICGFVVERVTPLISVVENNVLPPG
jgi:hypothetical protein